jgi:hypothetical protein
MRHRRREIRKDAAALAAVGIIIDGDRVLRSVQQKPDGVQQKPGVSRYRIRYMIQGPGF